MLNRRHIRIKVMQILYAFKGTESDDLKVHERFLMQSMENTYDLYLLMLSFMLEVHSKAEDYLAKSQQKHLATAEEIDPNRKFINNSILKLLKNNKQLENTIKVRKLNNWKLDDEYVDIIFKELINSDLYKNYMTTKKTSFSEEKDFIVDFFKTIVAPNDKLYDYFEDKNITWLDDLPVVNTVIAKLLYKTKQDTPDQTYLPELFKDEDDKDFGFGLLSKTILNLSKFNKEIAEKTTNWDQDRIANVDLVLLEMAICEFQKFPSIPTKVTINEYLEVAKEYSTPKSSVFINGVLDKLVKEYEAKGTLNKTGRGLM